MIHKTAAVLLFAASALCQEAIPARAFLLDDYRNIACVDLAKMRELDIWDDLRASVLSIMFVELEKELGGSLDALDRATIVSQIGEDGDVRQALEVRLLEGNAPLGVPKSMNNGWVCEEIEGRKVWQRNVYRAERMYQPNPNVQVWGTGNALDPVFAGKPRQGLPGPDVMSLLSGKGAALAYFVVDVEHPVLRRNILGKVFEGVEWPAGEEPKFVCMRVLATGDPDDPHLTVEVVLRHIKESGVAISDKAVEALLERVRTMPEMRVLRPVLARFQKRQDGADLRLVADLGRSRQAVGLLAPLALGVMMPAQVVEAQVIEAQAAAEEELVEEPPPPPPPAPPKKKGEGGGQR